VFVLLDNILCTGQREMATPDDEVWFQRRLDAPQTALTVAICRDQSDDVKDVKLSSGDLFVRATVGFDKAQHCAPNAIDSDEWERTMVAAAVAVAIACLMMVAMVVVGGVKSPCCK
jgi:hypothetical protein